MTPTELNIQFYFSLLLQKFRVHYNEPVNINVTLFFLGFLISFVFYFRKKSKKNWIKWGALFYFSIMELLQTAIYLVIDVCNPDISEGKLNSLLTTIAYIHISFQPFWINLFGLSFSQRGYKLKKWIKWTSIVMTGVFLLMVSRMFFHNILGTCDIIKTPLCGLDTCSYKGEWHISWRLALNGFDELKLNEPRITWSWFIYNIPVLFFPFFYGGWRWSLYVLFFGIFLSMGLTGNKDEFSSISGLISIPILLATYVPFIRNWLERPLRKK